VTAEGLPRRVWVDTDVALGAPAGDVDDGFALAALLGAASKRHIDLLGVSTVDGNTSAPEAERCARALLAAARVDTALVRGGGSSLDGGEAGRRIAALPEGAGLVAIGPLSNVAAAIERDPSLPSRVRLSVVGGNLSSRGFLPPFWPHEFNLARDRRSARAVLRAPWRELVFYPLDVLRRFRCDASRVDRLGSRSAVGALLAEGSRRWIVRTRWRHGERGFPVWDLPPALEAAGMLDVRVEERTFPRVQRSFSGIPYRARAVVAFDGDAAWRAFDGLVGAGEK